MLTTDIIQGKDTVATGHNAKPLVLEYVRRFETIAQDIAESQEELRDLKKEGKDAGINMKAVAVIVKQREETSAQKEKREEFESDLDTYKVALGMLS